MKKVKVHYDIFYRLWEVIVETPFHGFPDKCITDIVMRFLTESEAKDFATKWVEGNGDILELSD